jgi:hypothetical protein
MERGVTGAEFAGAMDVKDIAPTNESAAAILIVLIVSLLIALQGALLSTGNFSLRCASSQKIWNQSGLRLQLEKATAPVGGDWGRQGNLAKVPLVLWHDS